MSKIGHLQNCLEEIFDEFTSKFVNKMHWIQLQYRVKKNKRILVVVKVHRKEAEKETLKSAMYVTQLGDVCEGDIKIFLVNLIAMGLVRKGSMPKYWDHGETLKTSFFGTYMGRNTFQSIMSNCKLQIQL